MAKLILFAFLMFLSGTLVIGAEGVDLGDSKENVIEKIGKPTDVSELRIDVKTFVTYFYQSSNSYYVIDEGPNKVCAIALGKTEGYCYPCDYGPGAGTCP